MHFTKYSVVGSLLCAFTAWASPVAQIQALASEVDDVLSKRSVLGRRQDGCTTENPITGVDDGFIVPRQNIYDMERDGDLWNIYILGLLQMQERDQRDPLSFYRISCKCFHFASCKIVCLDISDTGNSYPLSAFWQKLRRTATYLWQYRMGQSHLQYILHMAPRLHSAI